MLWQAIGGFDDARRHGEAILTLARRADRPREIVVAHNNLTWHDIRVGDLAGADRRLRTVARLAADPGDARLQAVALANSADVARLGGRYRMAVETGRRALALLAEVGDPGHRVRAHGVVGLALAGAGDVDEAEMVRKSLVEAGAGAAGIRALIGGYVALRRGERDEAVTLFEEAASALLGHHDARDVVEALVGVAAATDDPAHRESVLDQLDEVCRHSGVVLLARDRALLGE